MIKRTTSIPERNIYIASDADVLGDVTIGEGSSVWYHSVVRGDTNYIMIGRNTNIQDGCVLHTDVNNPLEIGNGVTIGHRAIVHGCTIGDDTLIGMGAIVMNGARVGKNCIIGAGTLVTQGTVIPDGSMAFGSPAKVIRQLEEDEKGYPLYAAREYSVLIREHFCPDDQ